jgi:hypothetical protein
MLPKLEVPIYELALPLCKKKIKYRPFLVKEEKLLMMAMESEDVKTITDTIKQIANNCLLSELNVEEIPMLDLEYYFLYLRAKSVGEVSELQYKCNNNIFDENNAEKKCNHVVKLKVNLLEIEPTTDGRHSNKIELSPSIGMIMKYPNFQSIEDIGESSDVDKLFKIMLNCIDYIYDEDGIYYRKDITDEELTEFIENLSREQFAKIEMFFSTIPKLKKDLDFNCSKCGYKETIEVEGIQNFFV